MLKLSLLQAATLFAIADAGGKTGGDSDPLPVVQRTRDPEDFAKGSPEAKRMKQCRAAAETLRAQEERVAREEHREPNATPSAEELFAKVGDTKALPGVTINGIYVPTIEEIKAAGYQGDIEKFRANLLAQAEAAGKPAGAGGPEAPVAPPQPPAPAVPPVPPAPADGAGSGVAGNGPAQTTTGDGQPQP